MNVRDGRFVYDKTPAQIREDFVKLQRTDPEDLVERHTRWEVRTGCPTPHKLYLFRSVRAGQLLSECMHWKHRVRTSTRWWRSAQEVLDRWKRDPHFLRAAAARVDRATKNRTFTPDDLAYDTIRTNSSLMTMTHFRASVSKYLSDTTGAGTVLDFSAGWGDRLTGFMASSSVRHIHLIDPRPGSIACCRRQHAFVGSTKHLSLHQGGAEVVLPTLPSGTVDLIVSSPPYFNLEEYGETTTEAQGQIRLKVDSVEGYLRVFLEPVLRHSARLLRSGGLLALNIDDNPRADTIVCAPALAIAKTIPDLLFVGTAGLRKGSGFGLAAKDKTLTKAEPIYLWRKR